MPSLPIFDFGISSPVGGVLAWFSLYPPERAVEGVVPKIESIFDESLPDLPACLAGCECCFDFGEEDGERRGFGGRGFSMAFLETVAVAGLRCSWPEWRIRVARA